MADQPALFDAPATAFCPHRDCRRPCGPTTCVCPPCSCADCDARRERARQPMKFVHTTQAARFQASLFTLRREPK